MSSLLEELALELELLERVRQKYAIEVLRFDQSFVNEPAKPNNDKGEE